MAVAAANAMMVLNTAGMVFGGCDLSNATLGPAADWVAHKDQRHFMDVSGGVFDKANLTDALLSQSRLDGCSFQGASLAGADFSNISVGQLPMLLGHEDKVASVCI